MHPAQLDESELADQCQFSFLRRSGPGGQNRNKVETAVVALHTPTGIIAEANEERSQDANRKQAIRRLRLKLAVEIRTSSVEGAAGDIGPRTSQPSELWKSRIQGGSIKCSENHADYPALLAEALDFVATYEWNHAKAAESLQVSATQLVRLLGKYSPALDLLNQQRIQSGLRRLTLR
jgi:hypothetical protein